MVQNLDNLRADNKKITFIFQNEPFLLLTGYLEFHCRIQGKSGKSQGIPSWKKIGNYVTLIHDFFYYVITYHVQRYT